MNPLFRPLGPGYLALLITVLSPLTAHAFCGFYVARGDAKIFNKASRVALVRDGDRTVMTMANDFQGEPKEFAIVIPVPTVLRREQIHAGDPALIDHLDGYSAVYYTYMWSLVIAKDLFSQFDRANLMAPTVARKYRDTVLAPGDREWAIAAERERTGIPLDPETAKFLGFDGI